MGKIKQIIADHPNIWEFIKFNVLSNCATITNFIIMWLCTGFIFKSFANTPFKFLVFNYAAVSYTHLTLPTKRIV